MSPGPLGSLGSLGAMLRRRGISDGLFGGSRPCIAVGGLAWASYLLRRLMARPEVVVYRRALGPDEGVVIRHTTDTPSSLRVRRVR